MSWRKYGGTNKLDQRNNITVNTIVADKFTVRQSFLSEFQIQGDFSIYGNALIEQRLTVREIANIANLDVSGNATFNGKVYMSRTTKPSYLIGGNNYTTGINKFPDSATTFDISSNLQRTIGVHTSQSINRNILARNNVNQGIALYTNGITESSIQFYSGSGSNNVTENISGPDASISYNNTGNMVLKVNGTGDIELSSKAIITDRTANDRISNSTVIIYDTANGVYRENAYNDPVAMTGDALTLVAFDNSANTQMNIMTPDKHGMRLIGGVYPKDKSRGMAVIDVSNSTPSLMIVTGNSLTKYHSTIGINTYAPKVDQYVMDINGPIHVNNGEVTKTATVPFEIKSMSGTGLTGIAIGTPYTTAKYYSVYRTGDGGQTWSNIDLAGNMNTTNDIFTCTSVLDSNRYIIAGKNSYMFFTNDGGITWKPISFGSTITRNFTSVHIINETEVIAGYNNGFTIFTMDFTETASSYTPPSNNITDVSIDTNTKTGVSSDGTHIWVVYGQHILKTTIDNPINIASYIPQMTGVYNAIRAHSSTHVVAVGTNLISYTVNGTNWIHIPIPTVTFNSVYVHDEMRAIAVGDAGAIYITFDGYKTWEPISDNLINSTGYKIDRSLNISSVYAQNASTIIISSIKSVYAYDSTTTMGSTYLYHAFVPYLFNRENTSVMDLCGNMKLSGDLQVNNEGKIRSNNLTFDLLKDTVNTINMGLASTTTTIGSTSGNTFVRNKLRVADDIIGNAKLQIISDASLNAKLFVANDVSFNQKLTVGGNVRMKGSLVVDGVVSFTGNIFQTQIENIIQTSQQIDISNLITGIALTVRQYGPDGTSSIAKFFHGDDPVVDFKHNGDVSLNRNLYVSQTTDLHGVATVSNTTESTTQTNGALVVNGGVGIVKNMNIGGIARVMNTTDSINASTGALIVDGGVGISNKLTVGNNTTLEGKLLVKQQVTFDGMTESSSPSTGALIVKGGVGIEQNVNIAGLANISNTTKSISVTSGALQVGGGVGIIGNTHVGGIIFANNTTISSNTSTGALVVNGGAGISGTTNIGGVTKITDATVSTSTTSGALQVTGGVGISGVLHVSEVNIRSSTSSTGTTSGALQVTGGAGISGNIYVGETIFANSAIDSTNVSTGALVVSGGAGIAGTTNIGGITKLTNATVSTSATSGALQVTGGVGIGDRMYVAGTIYATATTATINTTTGALVVSGGVGIKGGVVVGDSIYANSTVNSSGATTGALVVAGGVGIGGQAYISGTVFAKSPTDSTDTTTGALVVSGGVGIQKNVTIGGITKITNNTQTVDKQSGALVVTGGIGVGENVYIGGTTESTSDATGALVVKGGAGITGNTYIKGITYISGDLFVSGTQKTILATTNDNPIDTTSDGTTYSGGSLWNGGITVKKHIYAGFGVITDGDIFIRNTINSTSTSSGALRVDGGAGIGGNVFIGGNLIVTGTTVSLPASCITTNNILDGTIVDADISADASISQGKIHNLVNSLFNRIDTSTDQRITSGIKTFETGSRLTIESGATLSVIGTQTFDNVTESTDTSTGAIIVKGGIGIMKNVNVGGAMNINSSVNSISKTTGGLVVTGGAGIGGNLFIGGNTRILGGLTVDGSFNVTGSIISTTVKEKITISERVDISNSGTGPGLVVRQYGNQSIAEFYDDANLIMTIKDLGDVSMNKALAVGGITTIKNTSASITTGTGALIVSGGAGIGGNVYIGGNAVVGNLIVTGTTKFESGTIAGSAITDATIYGNKIVNNTITGPNLSQSIAFTTTGDIAMGNGAVSTTTSTGALKVTGGAGITGNAFIGGNVVAGNLIVTGTTKFESGTIAGSAITDTTIYGNKIVSNTITGTHLSQSITFTTTGDIAMGSGAVSTTTSTGALKVTGGAGITGNAFIGGNAVVGNLIVTGTTKFESGTIAGSAITDATIYGNKIVNNTITGPNLSQSITFTTTGDIAMGSGAVSTTTGTGALKVSGGAGITGNAFIGGNAVVGNLIVTGTTKFESGTIAGSAITDTTIYGNKIVSNTIAGTHLSQSIAFTTTGDIAMGSGAVSITTGTGALKVTGGAGITGNVYAGGNVFATATTISTNTSTGSLVVSGGAGIRGNVFIGDNLYHKDTLVRTTRAFAIDLATGKSSSFFYPIEIQAPTELISGVGIPIEFTINAGSAVTLCGYVRPPGLTATLNPLMYDFTQTNLSIGDSDKRFLDIYYSTANDYKHIVIYARGGSQYTVITNGSNATSSPSSGTVSTTFAISKNPDGTGTDATGISTTIASVSGKRLYDNPNLRQTNVASINNSTTVSMSTASGALIVSGGAGIGGNLYVGGNTVIGNLVVTRTTSFSGTVSGITPAMVQLGSVDNTTDLLKPLSTATIAALAAKADSSSLSLKADKANPIFSGTVSGITPTMVGLGSVDNTTDASKPVSTLQQAALNLKANLASPPFTGTVSAPTISITSGTAVSITSSIGALQVSGGAGISGNVNIGGNIFLKTGSSVYVDGTVLSTGGGGTGQTTTAIDFFTGLVFSSSTTNFYAIEIISNINTGIPDGSVYNPIEFFITGDTIGSSSLYNEVTLYGIIRPDGNTDHKLYYEFTQTQATAGESRFYAIYTGTGAYKNIVIYARGGFKYSVTTNGTIGHYANKSGVINGIESNGSGFNSGIKESDGTVALGMTSISTPGQLLIGNSLLNTDNTMNTQIRKMGIMIKSTATSSSTSTGALVVAGGAGIAGSVYSGRIWAQEADGQVLSLAGNGTNGSYIRFYQNGFTTYSAFLGLGSTTNTFNISNQIVGNSINLNPNGSINITPYSTNSTYIDGGRVVCASDVEATYYNATSDFRIKTNILDMSGQSSLESLRNLKPTEYKLIANSDKSKVYGFIAQDVKETIPEAVSSRPGFVPSIYEMAFIDDDKTTVTLINKTTEDSWQKIKISDEPYDVADIIDDKTFRIKTEINKDKIELVDVSGAKLSLKDGVYRYKDTDEIYTGIVKDGIFVYGPEVPDFHSIDNNIIMTVTTRATQELDKQLQDARQRITTLENQVSELMEFMKNTNK